MTLNRGTRNRLPVSSSRSIPPAPTKQADSGIQVVYVVVHDIDDSHSFDTLRIQIRKVIIREEEDR